MISLDLKKGMTLDLTKHDTELKVLKIGLGWQSRYDLDVMAFAADSNGKILETVCYQNLRGKGIELDGDDLTGGKIGDCETVTVDFAKVPSNISRILLCVNIFGATPSRVKKGFWGNTTIIKGDTFSNVEGSYIRLYNANSREELCKYSLEEDGSDYNAFHFADLIKKDNGEWTFEAIGQGMNGEIAKLRETLTK